MKRVLIAGALSLMCVAGVAGAQDEVLPEDAAKIVAVRQASFAMSAATFGGIKQGLDAGVPLQQLAFASNGLSRWAASMTVAFVPGTGPSAVPSTKAKPEIWTDWTGFQAKAADYQSATARLRDAIAAGDAAAANEAWAATRATCGSCHDAYRS
ncbi:c-type cytochrome [Brevundimonas aurifodinae]